MKLKELMKYALDKCKNNCLEIEAVKLLLIELEYQSAANFLLSYEEDVAFSLIEKVNMYLDERTPVQYILGYTNFYGLKFIVNSNVLIPRFDTEVLVEEAIKEINKNKYLNCLDLCTGSGAIAISVSKNTNCHMIGSDISIEALEVAKENNRLLEARVEFIKSDILNDIDYQFDIILSNPPYIGYNDEVDSIVYDNEPHLALFASENGLYFYKKILQEIKEKQKNIKMIIFEIGYMQANDISEIANTIFDKVDISVIKDYAGKDRVLKLLF